MRCEWDTDDGPCPNESEAFVTITVDLDAEEFLRVVKDHCPTCNWHLANWLNAFTEGERV